jgi:three-Cys-motif partner protein
MQQPDSVVASDGLVARPSQRWAVRKHHFLRNYCGITTRSMKGKWRLVYLDVMAGPGRCIIEDTREELPGSPFVALEHEFSECLFVEEDPLLADALRRRVAKHPKADKVRIHCKSWTLLAEGGDFVFDESTLVVAFLDPTGISQLPMSAMRGLMRNPRIDLLVTIQYRLGIVWNVPQYVRSQADETALDRFLETHEWRQWTWKDASELGRLSIERFGRNMEEQGFICSRHVSVPENRPIYRFTLFSRHRLGERFWNEILKIDERGQREFPL